jgi:hypothetical protein
MAILAVTNTYMIFADALTDLEALGSDDNLQADALGWVSQTALYRPATVSASSSTWIPVSTAPTGFSGGELEAYSLSQQFTLTLGGAETTITTLASLATAGRNVKLEVYVTGVDNSSGGDQTSHRFIQTYYNDGAALTGMTAHLSNAQNTGTGNFATDITYNLFVSGSNIILRARNTSSTTTYTGNLAVWWTRQVGGQSS